MQKKVERTGGSRLKKLKTDKIVTMALIGRRRKHRKKSDKANIF